MLSHSISQRFHLRDKKCRSNFRKIEQVLHCYQRKWLIFRCTTTRQLLIVASQFTNSCQPQDNFCGTLQVVKKRSDIYSAMLHSSANGRTKNFFFKIKKIVRKTSVLWMHRYVTWIPLCVRLEICPLSVKRGGQAQDRVCRPDTKETGASEDAPT